MRKLDDFEGRSPYPRESGEIVPGWYRGYMRGSTFLSVVVPLFGFFLAITGPDLFSFADNEYLIVVSTILLFVIFLAHVIIFMRFCDRKFFMDHAPIFFHYLLYVWHFISLFLLILALVTKIF